MMARVLLTGKPGSGKTTTLRKILAGYGDSVGGFYTEEIRDGGRRSGFRIVTLDGQEGILARTGSGAGPRIGRYRVDLDSLEDVGVGSLRRALQTVSLVVVDEIGPMELLSKSFCDIILDIIKRDVCVLGTIVWRPHPFTDVLKARPDVTLLEVTWQNQTEIVERALALLNPESL